MAIREIIRINEKLCDGCAQCVSACAEGAIEIRNGKARLVSETYCDGLGACIGDCPQGAITIEKREAPDFDETAVKEHLARSNQPQCATASPATHDHPVGGGCPGAALRSFTPPTTQPRREAPDPATSALRHWPVQLMLVPPGAPFLDGADLLISADCVPFAAADFHQRYLAGKALLVGCPKLDDLQHYYEKLRMIFAQASPSSVTVLKMEVPCCNGIAQAAIMARNEVIPDTDLTVTTIGIHGEELSSESLPPVRAAV